MSTIKSSAEDLTLNADGSGNDVIIQSNASTKAIINAEGNVGIGVTPETWDSSYNALQIGGNGAVAATSSQAAGGKTLLGQNMYVDSGSGVYEYISTDEASLLYQQNGAFKFRVAASGTADAAITWTDAFEVLNAGQARAKNGLLFGTDTAAANTLDDYEEGTFIPTMLGSSSGNFVASTTNTLSYTKLGRLVTVTGKLSVDTDNSCSGTIFFSLPFTAATQSKKEFDSVGSVMLRSGGTTLYNNMVFNLGGGGTNGYIMFLPDSTTSENVGHVQVDGAWDVWFGYSYCAA